MKLLKKVECLSLVVIALFSLLFVACSDEPNVVVDNSIEGSDGVGIKQLELTFPAFDRLVVVSRADAIVMEMQGERDLKTYNLYANIEYANGEIRLSSTDEDLATLPHQEYFVNFVKFPMGNDKTRSAIEDNRSVTLGAKISIADPNNIVIQSTYNAAKDCFGTGSESDPISVVTMACLEQHILEELTQTDVVEHLKDIHFRQTRSINFALEFELFDGWTAAGKFNIHGLDVAFCGVYDGARNSIQDMQLATNSSTALFYKLGDGAVIKNVKMTGLDLKGGYYAGAIACKSSGDVTLQNIDVSGNISGYGVVGGMIGEGSASFRDCYSQMNISNYTNLNTSKVSNSMGGFIGNVTANTSFDICAYSGYISSTSGNTNYFTGGFVGSTADASAGKEINVAFVDCVAEGDLGSDRLSLNSVGGFVGNCGTFANILFNNVVSGAQYTMLPSDDDSDAIFGDDPELSLVPYNISAWYAAGGFVGYVNSSSKIIFSGNETYASEDCIVESGSYLGGFVGCARGDKDQPVEMTLLDRIYSNATLLQSDDDLVSGSYVGGIVGLSKYFTLIGNDKSISNDPHAVSMVDYGVGSFIGLCEDTSIQSVNFTNYYADAPEYFYDEGSNVDYSTSTLTNKF